MKNMPPDVVNYIDISSACERLISAKVYKTILKKFLTNKEIDKLLMEYHGNNLEEAIKTIHAIKGMVGNLSLTALYEGSVHLEMKLKQGESTNQDMEKFKCLWEKTKKYAALVVEAIG
ncbi:Hpt domain-containing protein [Anaeropeptidivorans aminofermentans]|jgi:HPt (histidine-containing phosphotransfer) domain-containing protein|uniref:Hpt domain-containing protein n=1 Tax=Anaeropeptidivorans aminofermentans TaxID=2934315 RepID=UPI0020242DB9|nr:hypothetical protein [Anaeropeptidivorans aminofermentans]MBE6013580.1 Hpt domain-containing protein [Lachnospiraceae bacterium]